MKKILSVFFLACCSCIVMAQDNVIDEIVWVVGDDAILRSDIETQRLYNQNEGVRLDGDPYCVIPEQMAIQKLYLNQAKIDSITVNENQDPERGSMDEHGCEPNRVSREIGGIFR